MQCITNKRPTTKNHYGYRTNYVSVCVFVCFSMILYGGINKRYCNRAIVTRRFIYIQVITAVMEVIIYRPMVFITKWHGATGSLHGYFLKNSIISNKKYHKNIQAFSRCFYLERLTTFYSHIDFCYYWFKKGYHCFGFKKLSIRFKLIAWEIIIALQI